MGARAVLLRHGATEWSISGQHTGRSDIPLVEQGRAQAEAAGQFLRGFSFVQVLVSPLQRAQETARLAGFEGAVDPDLMEWDYGTYDGLTTADIRQDRPGWSLWSDGVPEGERAAEVGRRADRVIEKVRRAEGDTLCVAHGHILRVLTARWLDLPPAGGRMFSLGAGAVAVLGWEHEAPVISAWNLGADLA